ncbi:MAG: AraC family transcriptional regulator [Eubacteriaceae bacterium]|nr:AraC family transcriptional regulator [Eubacteriaceae bacterium]
MIGKILVDGAVQNVLLALGKNQQISTIAAEIGYYDQSHLLKDFKQFTGISPRNYHKSREKMKS